MLQATSRELVKGTVPVLEEHGETLTRHFYRRMFEHNPELKHLFNQGHQQTGQQQQALALAVLSYAEQIDDPSVLLPVLHRIAHKHASLGIRPEHYPIVGMHLLASIREVLGETAAADRPDGLISNWMHDGVDEGAIIELSPPFGDFRLHVDRDTPVVLISGGVGLTPMVAMLNHLVQAQPARQVAFVHGARHRRVHALNNHVRNLAARHPKLSVTVFYEEIGATDRLGIDYDQPGRVNLTAIQERVILPEADYYLCGPVPFMKAKLTALQGLGVPADRVHYEVFGSHVLAAA